MRQLAASYGLCILFFSIKDRLATSRSSPAVDEQQDWTLVEGKEEGGFTVLEFTRKYITCDKNDLPITVSVVIIMRSLVLHILYHVFKNLMYKYKIQTQGPRDPQDALARPLALPHAYFIRAQCCARGFTTWPAPQ